MPSVWPFVPEVGATETFEYNTDILKTYNKEQRIRLRDNPRYILSNNYFLDDEQLAYAKAIAKFENQTGSYKVPVWQEASKFSGTISSGATTIAVDTKNYKFSGTEVMLWLDWNDYVICTISSQTNTSLILSAPVGVSITDPYIVPLKVMRNLSRFEFSTGAPNINYVSATFTSIDHRNYTKIREDLFDTVDLFDNQDIYSVAFISYKDSDVIVDPPYRVKDFSSSMGKAVQLIDNGFGPIAVEATTSYVEDRFNIDFFYQGNTQRVDTVAFICAQQGRQRSFWLPSFTKDIQLNSGTYSGTTLSVLPIGPLSNYTGKSLFIKALDGSYQFATITSAVVAGAYYTLTLEVALTTPVSNSVTDYVSFMRLSRFDADNVAITTGAAGSGKISLNSIEVPN